jgi:hypothetical protein
MGRILDICRFDVEVSLVRVALALIGRRGKDFARLACRVPMPYFSTSRLSTNGCALSTYRLVDFFMLFDALVLRRGILDQWQ